MKFHKLESLSATSASHDWSWIGSKTQLSLETSIIPPYYIAYLAQHLSVVCGTTIIFGLGLESLSAENMSHDQIQTTRDIVHLLKLQSEWHCFLSSLLFPIIIPWWTSTISLLLLVVLSAYSGSPQHAKPPDSQNPIRIANNSSAQLGILAPVPQNEMFMSILPQNGEVKWELLSFRNSR